MSSVSPESVPQQAKQQNDEFKFNFAKLTPQVMKGAYGCRSTDDRKYYWNCIRIH
jgi:hypothetical protein